MRKHRRNPLHNTHSVIASKAKQSLDLCAFHEIATSLTLLAMTKKQLCNGLKKVSIFLTITALFAGCAVSKNDENANAGWSAGSGIFGKWIQDEYGMVAYQYEMDPADPRTEWIKGDITSNLHWHQIGNLHINAIATNHGCVELFYNDSAQRWINVYNPQELAYSGGFGFISDGETAFTTYNPYRPTGTKEKLIFGSGYVEKELAYNNILLNETVFAPNGENGEDLSALIMRVKIKNLSENQKDITYIPYFDVETYDLFPPFLTAFTPEELKAFPSAPHMFQLEVNRDNSSLIARSIKQWGLTGGYPPTTMITDPELPDVFFACLDQDAAGAITDPAQIFTENGWLEQAFENISWPSSSQIPMSPKDFCIALPVKIALDPGEERVINFVYGYAKARQSEDIIADVSDPDALFDETIAFWKQTSPRLEINQDQYLSREIKWADYYLTSSFLYDAYYKTHYAPQGSNYLYYAGINGASRDLAAYIMTLSYYRPSLAKEMLKMYMQNQDSTGRLFYDFEGFGSRNIGGSLPLSGLTDYSPSDLSLWFLWAACEYIFATRDFDFLEEEFTYWPKENIDSATVLDHLIRAYDHLETQIGTGSHGLIQLRKSDWNDEMCPTVCNGDEVDYRLTSLGGPFGGESHLNTAMACYILPMFSAILKDSGDVSTADRVDAFLAQQKNALKAEWLDKGWFPRAYSAMGKELGKTDIYLEPQIWAMLSNGVLTDTQRTILIKNINEKLRKPSPLGMMVSSNVTGSPTCDPGEAESGGIWFAMNAPGSLALAQYDPKLGYEELLHNTLAWHGMKYPEIWFGIWSGPDAFNSLTASKPGQTWDYGIGPQRWPVQNNHSHSQFLWAVARMAGFEPTIDGFLIRPLLPLEKYRLETPCLGIAKEPKKLSGYFVFDSDGSMQVKVKTPNGLGNPSLLIIDGNSCSFQHNNGEILFTISYRANKKLCWELEYR